MTRRPFVFAFAVLSATARGADVISSSQRQRPSWLTYSTRRTFVSSSDHQHYERLLRGGSDTEEQSRSLIDTYETSFCSVQGGRAYMEDEYFTNQNGSFAACFDGHGGNAVSRYLRQNLYANVQSASPLSTQQECSDALKAALKKVDREVQRISHWSFQGSTAVAAWIVTEDRPDETPKRTVIAANVGDSRAVMSRNGVAVDLTIDHKPQSAPEKARVEALGGKVIWCGIVDDEGNPVPNAGIYRVNGNLSLSRAIGDRSERPAVTSKPDMTAFDIEDGDDFIILGTDGLWDVMSSQDAVAFVHDTLQNAGPALENATEEGSESDHAAPTNLVHTKMADLLVAEALKRGTTDNVTVIVMWLKRRTE